MIKRCASLDISAKLSAQEADGIAFYYTSFSATNEDIEFNLYSGAAKVASFTATGKTVVCSGEKCVNAGTFKKLELQGK